MAALARRGVTGLPALQRLNLENLLASAFGVLFLAYLERKLGDVQAPRPSLDPGGPAVSSQPDRIGSSG